MKAIELLNELTVIISTARLFYENEANFKFNKAYEERIYEAIKELETLQQSLKSVMLNYDECYDRLVKCQKYIIDLENQIKDKSNGWMNK